MRRGEVERLLPRLERETDRAGTEPPTETRRTSSGAGCNTPAPAARRKPSRWAGTTGAERELRWHRSSEGGQLPGVDARRVNRRRGTQRTNREEGPILIERRFGGCFDRLSEGGGEEPPPAGSRPGNRLARHRDRSRRVAPGRRETSKGTGSSTRCAGQPAASSRRSASSFGSARSLPRQLAVGSTTRASVAGNNQQPDGARSRDRLPRGGAAAQTAAGTGGASEGRATGLPRPPPRLDPPGRGRKSRASSRGDVARRNCFSPRCTCESPIRATPERQPESGQGGGGSGKGQRAANGSVTGGEGEAQVAL